MTKGNNKDLPDLKQGQKVRQLREQLGMTQEELAIKVGYAGRSAINKIESEPGREIPQSKMLAFAKALNTSISYLMGWEDEAPEIVAEKVGNAMHLIKHSDLIDKYMALSERDKRTIDIMIDTLTKKEEDN